MDSLTKLLANTDGFIRFYDQKGGCIEMSPYKGFWIVNGYDKDRKMSRIGSFELFDNAFFVVKDILGK